MSLSFYFEANLDTIVPEVKALLPDMDEKTIADLVIDYGESLDAFPWETSVPRATGDVLAAIKYVADDYRDDYAAAAYERVYAAY